jgi:hypothetical protein
MERINPDGSRTLLASVNAPAQLGRPALDGDRLVFHQVGRVASKIVEINLATGKRETLRSTRRGVMLNPSLSGERLIYVHSTFERQKLKLGTRGGKQNGEKDKVPFSMVPTARRDSGFEPGKHRHNQGYRNKYGQRQPERPKPGVVETLWDTVFAAGGANVTKLHHRPDGGIDTAVIAVKL